MGVFKPNAKQIFPRQSGRIFAGCVEGKSKLPCDQILVSNGTRKHTRLKLNGKLAIKIFTRLMSNANWKSHPKQNMQVNYSRLLLVYYILIYRKLCCFASVGLAKPGCVILLPTEQWSGWTMCRQSPDEKKKDLAHKSILTLPRA